MGKSKVNITNWPCHAWSQIKNKKWWPTNKVALGLCYRLLCTHYGLVLKYMKSYFHVLQHQTIIFMGKMVFISDEQFVRWSQKVYQKCLFQRSGDQNFKKNSPWCPNDSTKSKETQSLGKNSCREKCLDKSLLTLSLEIFVTFIVPPGRKLKPKGNIVSTVMIFNGVR